MLTTLIHRLFRMTNLWTVASGLQRSLWSLMSLKVTVPLSVWMKAAHTTDSQEGLIDENRQTNLTSRRSVHIRHPMQKQPIMKRGKATTIWMLWVFRASPLPKKWRLIQRHWKVRMMLLIRTPMC